MTWILFPWQEFQSFSRNFISVAGILILWQEFDSYGINFILSEKMRQFMRGFGFRIPVRYCVFPVYNVPTSPGKITVCLEEFQNLKIRIMEFWVLEFWPKFWNSQFWKSKYWYSEFWNSDLNFVIANSGGISNVCST